MKRKLFIGLLGAGIIFGGAFVVGAADGTSVVKDEAKKKEEMISIEEAKSIALKEVQGELEGIELEYEYNRVVYEVEVEKNDDDYDVYVDAYSGEVLTVKKDDDDNWNDVVYHDNGKTVNTTAVNEKKENHNIITHDEAVAVAEKAVNGKVLEVELDHDDGLLKYEIELKTDRGEAEVEVDAVTGKVLEIELDD